MAQLVTRIGDKDAFHAPCGQPFRAMGNPRMVYASGILGSVLGMPNTIHDMPNPNPPPPCIPHIAVIQKASTTVFFGGIPIGRVGDPVGPKCTVVVQGAPRPVFAGG